MHFMHQRSVRLYFSVRAFALDGLQEILGFFDGCAQTEQVVVQVDDDGPEPASLGGHVPP